MANPPLEDAEDSEEEEGSVQEQLDEDQDEFDEDQDEFDEDDEIDEDDFIVDDDEEEDGDEEEDAPNLLLMNRPETGVDTTLADLRQRLAVFGGIEIDVRPSPVAGLGLFALRDFARGEEITEYSGEYIAHSVARTRIGSTDSHIRRHIALRWDIDGLREPQVGSGAGSFANDAIAPYEQNADFDFVDSRSNVNEFKRFSAGLPAELRPEQRITFLRAIRPIKIGEEIFVDYGRDTRARYQAR